MRALLVAGLLAIQGCVQLSECIPGKANRCGCGDGLAGVQVCGDDGTFGACDCSGDCEPLSCDEVDAECGEPDDGCGGTLSCGDCDEPLECVEDGDALVCGCDDDLVLLDDTCDLDECADGTAECGEHATCENTVGAYTCACDDGYAGDGQTCVPDPYATVQDVSDHPIAVSIDGVGDFTVGAMSSIGMRWSITRVPRFQRDIPYYDTLELPPVVMGEVRGPTDEVGDLIATAAGEDPVDLSVTLRGVGIERRVFATFDAQVEVLDAGTTVVGDTTVLARIRVVPTKRWEQMEVTQLPQDQWAVYHPGEEVEISGILCCWGAGYPAGTLGFENTTRDLHFPGVFDGSAAFNWFTMNTLYFLDDEEIDRRSFSVIQRDADGDETFRRNGYEATPSEVRVFDSLRPYFTTPLVSVTLALAWAEDA